MVIEEELQDDSQEETEAAEVFRELTESYRIQGEFLELMRSSLSATAFESFIERRGTTLLMFASIRGHSAQVSDLISASANVEARDSNGLTALMFAALLGHLETVRILLAAICS